MSHPPCPVLGSPVPKRQGYTRASPAKGHEGGWRLGASLTGGEAEKAPQAGERKAQGRSY